MRIRPPLVLALILCGVAPAPQATAAPTPGDRPVARRTAPDERPAKKTPPPVPRRRRRGWSPRLTLGITTALAYNHQVVGVASGLAFHLGAQVFGQLTYHHDSLQWVTSLRLVNAHAKHPVVAPVIKTADRLELDSRLVYRFTGKMKKVFLYGGVALTTPMFPGDLVPAADRDLVLTRADGSQVTAGARADQRFRLTPAFAPLFFKQLLGSGAEAYQSKLATLGLYLGLTAQEIRARGWTVADRDTTPELELNALRDYQQLGVHTGFTLRGSLHKRLTYELLADFTYPLYTSVETHLEGFGLLDIDLAFSLSLKIARWVSVDYRLSVRRLPLILERWQITNHLLVAITADVM